MRAITLKINAIKLKETKKNIKKGTLQPIYQNERAATMKFKQVNNFYNYISKARNSSKFSKFLSLEDESYYEDRLNFIANDGETGFSINSKGYITSVFNNSEEKNTVKRIMAFAKSLGFEKLQLDCFDGKLTEIYSKQGFKIIERIPFDEQYAPINWDYKKYGKPDVLVMEYVKQ